MQHNVLVTGPGIASSGLSLLEQANCRVIFLQQADGEDAVSRILKNEGIDGIISRSVAVSAQAIMAAGTLRVISKHGVGFNNIDVAAATRRKIPVTITAGANAQAVAEFTIGLLIAAARGIPSHDKAIRAGHWRRPSDGMELSGQVLGLVGAGNVGIRVARIASAIGMRVVAFDPGLSADRRPGDMEFVATLDELVRRANIISLHCPLTQATRGMISADIIAAMRPGALLVNTSRGEVVDEAAMVAALRDGHLAAAGLDTFHNEPLKLGNPLLELTNVVLSPHVAASTRETAERVAISAVENLLAVLRGNRPAAGDLVNPEVYAGE